MTWEYAAVACIAIICLSAVACLWLYLQRSDSTSTEELRKLEVEVSKIRLLESRLHQIEINISTRGVFR